MRISDWSSDVCSSDLKQAELAEMAGISRSTLARLEAGNGGTIDSLARIMRALEIEDRLLDVMPDAKMSPLAPRSDTGKARQRVRKSSEGEDGEERSEERRVGKEWGRTRRSR